MVRFNQEQLKYLADIFNNAGVIFFASMVLPIFNPRFGSINYRQLVLGFGYFVLCWIIGFIILKSKGGLNGKRSLFILHCWRHPYFDCGFASFADFNRSGKGIKKKITL